MYLCFIDYSKAYDCVNVDDHNKNGISKHLTDLVSKLYKDKSLLLELELATQSGSALEGDSDRGVFSRQVFSMCNSEDIMREALHGFEGGVRFGGERNTDFRYADDTTLICSSVAEMS